MWLRPQAPNTLKISPSAEPVAEICTPSNK